jgi:hypothetical protein
VDWYAFLKYSIGGITGRSENLPGTNLIPARHPGTSPRPLIIYHLVLYGRSFLRWNPRRRSAVFIGSRKCSEFYQSFLHSYSYVQFTILWTHALIRLNYSRPPSEGTYQETTTQPDEGLVDFRIVFRQSTNQDTLVSHSFWPLLGDLSHIDRIWIVCQVEFPSFSADAAWDQKWK